MTFVFTFYMINSPLGNTCWSFMFKMFHLINHYFSQYENRKSVYDCVDESLTDE